MEEVVAEAAKVSPIAPTILDSIAHLSGSRQQRMNNRVNLLTRPSLFDQVGYTSKDIAEIQQKLGLAEQDFVKLQLKRANELNDPERVINREVRLKEIYLSKFGHMFTLDKYPLLQDPVDWASQKRTLTFGNKKKEALTAGFLQHTKHSIHAPLTQLEKPLDKGESARSLEIE